MSNNIQKLKTRYDQTHIKVTQQLASLEPETFLSQSGDLYSILVQVRGEIKESLAEGDSLLSELEAISKVQDSALEQDFVISQKSVWQSLRTRFRQANLKLTRELESKYYERQRESLFGSSNPSKSGNTNTSNRGKRLDVNNTIS